MKETRICGNGRHCSKPLLTFVFILLMCGIVHLFGCPDDFVIGPKKIRMSVSSGTRPTFSWYGGPVSFIVVTHPDTTVTHDLISGYPQITEPIVWGFITNGGDDDNTEVLHSPVVFGEMPENAYDLSDSCFRCDSLTVGKTYRVRIFTKFATRAGTMLFTVK